MKKLLLILALAVLTACQSIDSKMASYVGKHKSEMLIDWGAPTQITEDGNGGEILQYQEQSSWNYNVIVTRAFFVRPNGIIYAYRWKGH